LDPRYKSNENDGQAFQMPMLHCSYAFRAPDASALLLGRYIEVCVLYGLQICKMPSGVFATLLGSAVSVVWEERVADRGATIQTFHPE